MAHTQRVGGAVLACVVIAGCTSGTDTFSDDAAPDNVRACIEGRDNGNPASSDCGDARCAWRSECGGSGVPPTRGLSAMYDSCADVSSEAAPATALVDIVWTIDNSGSMTAEIEAVESNLNAFSQAIGSMGIDYRLVMISCGEQTDGSIGCDNRVAIPNPLGGDAMRYRFIDTDVDSHDALSDSLDFFTQYSDLLRPESSVHFIGVTDDESSITASEFKTQMETKLGRSFTYHAIASETVAGNNNERCEWVDGNGDTQHAARAGKQYYALADQTGGSAYSICTNDWSALFGELTGTIAKEAPIPCTYDVPAPPAGAVIDLERASGAVNVDGAAAKTLTRHPDAASCGSGDGWYYVPESNQTQLRLCPTTCDFVNGTPGAALSLSFACLPIVG